MHRAATSLTAVALFLGLLGTCPCAIAAPEAGSAAPARESAEPSPCCPDSAPRAALRQGCCCGEHSPAETPILSSSPGVPGPNSVVDLGIDVPISSPAASLRAGVSHPPPPRLGGLVVLRI